MQACVSNFTKNDVVLLVTRIAAGYRVRLSLDDMPVVVRSNANRFTLGYPIGKYVPDESKGALQGNVHVMNHLDFVVRYHIPDEYEAIQGASGYSSTGNTYRVVGFEVTPRSYTDNKCIDGKFISSADKAPLVLPVTKSLLSSTEITFTYGVKFTPSDVRWVTRFDTLLKISPGRKKVHLFAIVNSFMLAVMLTATLAAVLIRTLHRDCVRYGLSGGIVDEFEDEFDSDIGWRMLRGDVFRPPNAAGMLSVLCGSGVQLVIVAFVTLGFALIGILSPRNRGSLITALLTLWILSSGVGGTPPHVCTKQWVECDGGKLPLA